MTKKKLKQPKEAFWKEYDIVPGRETQNALKLLLGRQVLPALKKIVTTLGKKPKKIREGNIEVVLKDERSLILGCLAEFQKRKEFAIREILDAEEFFSEFIKSYLADENILEPIFLLSSWDSRRPGQPYKIGETKKWNKFNSKPDVEKFISAASPTGEDFVLKFYNHSSSTGMTRCLVKSKTRRAVSVEYPQNISYILQCNHLFINKPL